MKKSSVLIYCFSAKIPKEIFNPLYPPSPETFGDKLRKIRIDQGLLVKDLADKLGVVEDTIINWEIRGRMPARWNMAKVEVFMAG